MASIVEFVQNQYEYDESDVITHQEETRLKSLINLYFPLAKIKRIEKLNNKYLYASFMLKKSEKSNYLVEELIHSTAARNIRSIEKENLDWRRVTRAKYGYGVSFSANADYANFYSSFAGGSQRAFVVCDVLVADVLRTDTCEKVPSGDVDTHKSYDGHVYVKFDDFTIYPKYALYYDKPNYKLSRFYTR